MTNEPQLKTMTMSQARHDFNSLPKFLESSPEPLYIEHQGNLVMTILGMQTYTLMTGAIEFIKANGQLELFDRWITTEMASADAAEAGVEFQGLPELNGDEQEIEDTALARAAIVAQIKEDPEFGAAFLKNLAETREWVEQVIQENQNAPAEARAAQPEAATSAQ